MKPARYYWLLLAEAHLYGYFTFLSQILAPPLFKHRGVAARSGRALLRPPPVLKEYRIYSYVAVLGVLAGTPRLGGRRLFQHLQRSRPRQECSALVFSPFTHTPTLRSPAVPLAGDTPQFSGCFPCPIYGSVRVTSSTRCCPVAVGTPVVPTLDGVGTLKAIISQLDIQPACAPVNASHPASRLTTHDSGTGWLARPFLCGYCIHDSSPVYPGAPRHLSDHLRT